MMDYDLTRFEEIALKLKSALRARTDAALARALGCSPTSYALAKMRQRLPYGLIVDACEKHGISLDWLFLQNELYNLDGKKQSRSPQESVEA
jgi:hypothetical protein